MQHQRDPRCPTPPSEAWGNRPGGCGAHPRCKQIFGHPEKIINVECFSLEGKVLQEYHVCVCALASVVYLDHVKVILIRENSVHLTVQFLEGVLDGVSLQCVIALIFMEEMVACKTKESIRDAANNYTVVRLENLQKKKRHNPKRKDSKTRYK